MYKSENMESKESLFRFMCSRKDNIRMYHMATLCNYVDWVNLEQKLETRPSLIHEHILYQHILNLMFV